MILTYHEAIELMGYLPMTLPALDTANDDQSELGHLHQELSDFESLAQNNMIDNLIAEGSYIRQTA